MAALDDLASAYQALADSIAGVDVDSAATATDDLVEQAAAIGSSDLTTALAGVKETAESIRKQLDELATSASSVAQSLSGMT